MIIECTSEGDLAFVYYLFDQEIKYQKKKLFPVWPGYDKDTLNTDIQEQKQLKIMIENEVACVLVFVTLTR
jgi:hypothetical protein